MSEHTKKLQQSDRILNEINRRLRLYYEHGENYCPKTLGERYDKIVANKFRILDKKGGRQK